jgi:hypothetical protein
MYGTECSMIPEALWPTFAAELVEREEVDHPLYLLHGEERADNIEMKTAPSKPRRVAYVHGVKHHGTVRAKRGRCEELNEGRQPPRGTDSLGGAYDDAIRADRQRIVLALGNFSPRGDADWRGQRVEVAATAKLDADGGDVVGRCASHGLDRFEPDPGAAGNVPAEAINDRL